MKFCNLLICFITWCKLYDILSDSFLILGRNTENSLREDRYLESILRKIKREREREREREGEREKRERE